MLPSLQIDRGYLGQSKINDKLCSPYQVELIGFIALKERELNAQIHLIYCPVEKIEESTRHKLSSRCVMCYAMCGNSFYLSLCEKS